MTIDSAPHPTDRNRTLTPTCERKLAGRARGGDRAARDELVRANRALVASVAEQYRHVGVDMADLRQEGFVGLMQAVERFDPDRGTRFSTYAVRWIHRGVLESVRAQESGPHLPPSARRALRDMTAKPDPAALDAMTDDGGPPAVEPVDERTGDPAVEVERAELSTALWAAVGELPSRQRKAIGFHFGAGINLTGVASRMGISRSAVAGLIQRALRTLRPQPQLAL